MIPVVIVGGPHDGDEIMVEDASNRVHVAEVADTPQWLAYAEEIGMSVHEAVMPVRMTPNGYRAYWNERA